MSLTLNQLFDLAEFQPNPQQNEAICHTDGPLFLVAGPGSGKTRVLLWRTLNLIVFHGVQPQEIFLGTFTEKAAKQLKDGLLSLLGLVSNATGQTFDLSPMYVGTVHSLCQRLLTDRAFAVGRARKRAPGVLDALDQHFHLHRKAFWRDAQAALGLPEELETFYEQVNEYFEGRPSVSRHKLVTNLSGLFNRFSEENLSPDMIEQGTDDEIMRQLARLYRFYRESLKDSVDLSLLQQAAYQVVAENPAASGLFKHVIVDEYQDTNAIQERLFFKLAADFRNICVVGDDDQALYRFRGATVENFVQFPERCQLHLACQPRRIELATNYRSRAGIVDFYSSFMEGIDWRRADAPGSHYRLADKGIHAHSHDTGTAVVASAQAAPDDVAEEVAGLVKRLLSEGRVADPSQIAFLFPSLRSSAVQKMQLALEARGLKVYAPRAKRFLEAEEPMAMLGLFAMILGKPDRNLEFGGEYKVFHDWLEAAFQQAKLLAQADPQLSAYIKDRQAEIKTIQSDREALLKALQQQGWTVADAYNPAVHKRALVSAAGLSQRGRRGLGMAYLDRIAEERLAEGTPFTLNYIVNRASSLDWNVLDLFYRLCGFGHFKAMFDLAERGEDEGPICNLSLVSQLLSRYIDEGPSVITSALFEDHKLSNMFFGSYLYTLFRLGEGEYEDADDPFPKGRIPFLTIHQSKGLEFPVVVLGSPNKRARGPQRVEVLVRPFLSGDPEPLDRVADFDIMRMFYVALSRAKNLLIVANPRGQGISTHPVFKDLLQSNFPRIAQLAVEQVPAAGLEVSEISRAYSYTGDFLGYQRCPRQYMLFRMYGFAGSRTQTMLFGSVVHQTIEDLHNFLIARREATV